MTDRYAEDVADKEVIDILETFIDGHIGYLETINRILNVPNIAMLGLNSRDDVEEVVGYHHSGAYS